MKHLLVTNDFPPKIGGIQNYLWELWRRLPSDSFTVYTTAHRDAKSFDAQQPFEVIRAKEKFLGPFPWLPKRIQSIQKQTQADFIIYDPAWPLGFIAPKVDAPYGVVLHGAEVAIPGRLPLTATMLRRALRHASFAISAGQYPLAEAKRCLRGSIESVHIPPGVDSKRFVPLDKEDRSKARADFGVAESQFLVSAVSRLVPRKGMDTLIQAADQLKSRIDVKVIVGGTGRQEASLRRLVERLNAPVELVGRLSDDDVTKLYGASDAMAMLCNERWFGLEQEGFGIVFLEAAACGVPQIAGRSGGSHEAVEDGKTGIVVDDSTDVNAVAEAILKVQADETYRRELGAAARQRSETFFDYDYLAAELQEFLSDSSRLLPPP